MKGIIFDLDGTLVDSAPDLHVAANAMLAEFDLAPYSQDEIRGFIGHGIRNLVQKCLDGQAEMAACPDIETALASMIRHYSAAPATLSKLYGGLDCLLPSLAGKGMKLGVCTNKDEDIARKMIDLLGLGSFFGSVIGAAEGRKRKPDPEPVNLCLGELGLSPEETLYVGDSEADEAAAKAAALPFGFYTNGYRHAPVEAFSYAFRFDHFRTFEMQLMMWKAQR